MILIDTTQLKKIEEELAKVPNGVNKALSSALRDATRGAAKEVSTRVRDKYAVRSAGLIRKAVSVQTPKATSGDMEAIVSVTGSPLRLKEFKFSPRTPMTGRTRRRVKAAIIAGQMNVYNNRTFTAQMSNGHFGIFHRVTGKFMKGRREAIDERFGPSIAVMAGGERVRPGVEEYFKSQFEKRLAHYLDRYGG